MRDSAEVEDGRLGVVELPPLVSQVVLGLEGAIALGSLLRGDYAGEGRGSGWM